MIERKFIAQKMKEFLIQEFVKNNLRNVGHSHTKMMKTPLGEKIVVYASRPGLIVGRKGENIKQLTRTLKKKFNLENPQIEINEVENINQDANIVSERIVDSLEKFGTSKFKGIGHKVMTDVMRSGTLGIEILISGKIPSSRARSWRFYSGYLKKCGDVALEGVKVAYAVARLKTGIVGVKVSIMPADIVLPDKVELRDEPETVVEEVKPDSQEKKAAKPKKAKKKRVSRKKKVKDNKNGA